VSPAGLLLAAGAGSRMGMPKALVTGEDGTPWLVRGVAALREGGCDPVTVVLGAAAEEAMVLLPDGARVVVAEDWADGMSASLRCGLRAAAGSDEVVVLLGDQPGVGADAVARVRAAAGDAARATYGGAPGHPVVLRAALLARAGELRGDAGFRALLGGAAEVECGDLGDPSDIDTRDDLEVMR
jgi:CTP:molybdopterin cytidylyltransferase MocA